MTGVTLSFYLADALSLWLIVMVCAFAYFRLDDLCFDLAFWVTWLRRRRIRRRFAPFTTEKLYERAQQRIAIIVPCWHEAEIIDKMVEYAMRHIDYDRFDILVGVYPNDEATVENVRRASRRFPRVHAIVNERDGPTTKAQNLNCIYRAMREIEGDDPFRIVVLHDVEDVIHPLEMRLHNHLLPERQMVQTPVFPLEQPWYNLLAWTYADEFARNHLKDMLLRERIGAFVPSAGVGTAFSRDALESVAESNDTLFPEASLTEDYQFGLRLHQRGLRTIFVSTRLSPERKGRAATATAYVATREFFPDRLGAAVRQKSRWVAGICLQTWSDVGWRGRAATRYALYRDRKGVVSNLLALCGWVALVLSLCMYAWHHFDDRVFVPTFASDLPTLVLLDFVLIGTMLELLQTACFTTWIYGPFAGALSIVRAPIAALVNGLATSRALFTFVTSRLSRRPMRWAKTQHAFPTEAALSEFHRQLGQVLIAQGSLIEGSLADGLNEQTRVGGLLGEVLVRLGFVSEGELSAALAAQECGVSVNPLTRP